MELRFVELAELNPSNEARKRVTTKVAFQHFVLPIDAENGTLEVAVCDPFDSAMINAVQYNAGGTVKLALATRGEIEKALKKYYGVGAETLEELEDDEDDTLDIFFDADKEITEGDDSSVIKFVNQVIWEAYKDRATDIHFEVAEDEFRIRYRVDGILHQTRCRHS